MKDPLITVTVPVSKLYKVKPLDHAEFGECLLCGNKNWTDDNQQIDHAPDCAVGNALKD